MIPARELDNVACLAMLSLEERASLARRMVEIPVLPGQDILREGSPSSAAFVLLDGQLSVRKRLVVSGHPYELPGILPVGEWFGLVSVLDGAPASARVRAVTAARLGALGKDDFEGLLRSGDPLGPKLLRAWLSSIADQLQRVNESVLMLRLFLEQNKL
ncbi:cyclic nucleotide-binding domain-containing protein [Myxococcota bacterium]|nr:cyclic nucleotide-binding domain-containing protein [Myxococcota bacterium]